MKKGSGKRKGSAFEREISKKLSLWMTKGKRKDLFWRTHSSGMLGTKNKMRLEYGDIMAIDDDGRELTDRFSIECRCGKIIRVRDLIYEVGNAMKFLKEGFKTAKESDRAPLWIFRETGKPIMVMCLFKDFKKTDCVHVYLAKWKIILVTFEVWKKEFSLYEEG